MGTEGLDNRPTPKFCYDFVVRLVARFLCLCRVLHRRFLTSTPVALQPFSPCAGQSGTCLTCEAGFWGSSCAPCTGIKSVTQDGVEGGEGLPCSGHGTCSGSGTILGDGSCTCDDDWGGNDNGAWQRGVSSSCSSGVTWPAAQMAT